MAPLITAKAPQSIGSQRSRTTAIKKCGLVLLLSLNRAVKAYGNDKSRGYACVTDKLGPSEALADICSTSDSSLQENSLAKRYLTLQNLCFRVAVFVEERS